MLQYHQYMKERSKTEIEGGLLAHSSGIQPCTIRPPYNPHKALHRPGKRDRENFLLLLRLCSWKCFTTLRECKFMAGNKKALFTVCFL